MFSDDGGTTNFKVSLTTAYCATFHLGEEGSWRFDLYNSDGGTVIPPPVTIKKQVETGIYDDDNDWCSWGDSFGGSEFFDFSPNTYKDYLEENPRLLFVEAAFMAGINHVVYTNGYIMLDPISRHAFQMWQMDKFLARICAGYFGPINVVLEIAMSSFEDGQLTMRREYWADGKLVEYDKQLCTNGVLKPQFDAIAKAEAAERAKRLRANGGRSASCKRANARKKKKQQFPLFKK